jgi:hypothetical protein
MYGMFIFNLGTAIVDYIVAKKVMYSKKGIQRTAQYK